MLIEILSFEGCPNRDIAVERLRAAFEAERVTADVAEVYVADSVAAQSLRFLGSPTIRIDGLDVEPSAGTSNRFGFMCRTYLTDRGSDGAPSVEMIRAALRARRSHSIS